MKVGVLYRLENGVKTPIRRYHREQGKLCSVPLNPGKFCISCSEPVRITYRHYMRTCDNPDCEIMKYRVTRKGRVYNIIRASRPR